MANYRYTKQGEIVEKSTGYIVHLTSSKKESIKYTNWLNAGGAFNGWTPQFFLNKKVKQKYSI